MPSQWAGRPTAAARGYGSKHQRLRAWWAKRVATGEVYCWRCRECIAPGSEWELGHDDERPGQYKGPEHRRCNQTAGASKGGRSKVSARRPAERHPGLL